jgi:predicted SAM-dependent methyltransferase
MGIREKDDRMTKLNVGCGGRRIAGYTGVDAVAERSAAEIIARADAIPLPDGSVEEIMAIHLIEHVHLWEAPNLLREWFRLLMPGGLLVLEMPDLMKCCRNIVEGYSYAGKHPDQAGLWGLFGDPRQADPFMGHKWSYTFKTLRPMVAEAGFTDITERPTQWHPVGRDRRDFRLEARKP